MKPIHHALFWGALTLAGTATAEKVAQPKNNLPEERIQIAEPQLPQPPQVDQAADNKHTLSITKEELAKRPDLIIRGLIPALLQNNSEAVALLLPLYKQQAQQDPFLLAWGEAVLATRRGDYAPAVQQYRELFAQRPDILGNCESSSSDRIGRLENP